LVIAWLLASLGLARAAEAPAEFALNADTPAVAIQFDAVPAAAGIAFSDPALVNGPPHGVESNQLASGATRFLVWSTTNAILNPAGTVRVNLAVSSPDQWADGLLRIENVIVTDAAGQAAAARPDAKPIILTTTPAAYRSVQVGSPAALSAEAIDLDGILTSVAFRIDGATLGNDATPPFTWTWTPAAAGNRVFEVRATGGAGATTSDPVTLRAYAPAEITSYAAFAGIHFGPGAGNRALAAPDVDPTGCGMPNGLVYLTGSNPWSPDLTLLPMLTGASDGTLRLRFRRSTLARDASASLFHSANLQPASWQPLTGVLPLVTPLGNFMEDVVYSITPDGPRHFYRLQATAPWRAAFSFEVTSIIPAGLTTPAAIVGVITGGPPGATVIVQSSSDLGRLDPWADLATLTLDPSGTAFLGPVSDPHSINLPANFFRLKFP
jgi:hypothetical protein